MRMTIDGVELPKRKTLDSCGYDIYCPKDVTIFNGKYTYMDLGIVMEEGDIPKGCFAMIVPRSSTGFKYGLRLANSVGVIDSDYRDPIRASLTVDAVDYARFHTNDRILQMIIVPYGVIPSEIPPTESRKGGLGSTGR